MKQRVLLDLKPALDGFAGIPQETRLLFSGLRRIEDLDVRGLLQHGATHLARGLPSAGTPLSAPEIYRLSSLVVSLSGAPKRKLWQRPGEWVRRGFGRVGLQARALVGAPLRTAVFDSRLFTDFMWRTFFEKTLHPRERGAISADDYYVVQPPRSEFQKVGVSWARWWGRPIFPVVDTRGFNWFIAQTPYPGRVSPGTQMIVRYHDAVPILMPHTIQDKAFHQATHFHALRSNVASGAWFSCISEATRRDLLTVFPELEGRSFVVHNMVSDEYFEEDTAPELAARIVRNRLAQMQGTRESLDKAVPERFAYLLMVSTLEPRKNHRTLLSAWERLKYGAHPNLKLVLVGGLGWEHEPLVRAMKPWAEQGELFYLQNVPSAELRVLYRHAAATVCPSLSEGFDYSGVEAMRCGCPVASSGIPVHREIFADASSYFDPYSADDAAAVLDELIATPELRTMLQERGREVSRRYLPQTILPLWGEFFHSHLPLHGHEGSHPHPGRTETVPNVSP